MKRILLPLLFLAGFIEIFPQKVIYKTDNYTIFSDRVEQGQYTAQAVSREEMKSNYVSTFERNTSRSMVMKFAINGEDNERKPGADHHFTLSRSSSTDTARYKFGMPDPAEYSQPQQEAFLEQDKDLVIQLDMRDVLNDIKTKGYFETYNGNKIAQSEFDGVYAAGGTQPLTWNWPSVKSRKDLKLSDPDGDGIYELKIHITKTFRPGAEEENKTVWKLSKDISQFPKYESENLLTDALYNMAMEEMLLDIRRDGAFMAGAQWGGVWTRDISYSILHSLAIVNPDAARVSLMAKVKNGKIIQDTGTGGAWPVSTDRMTWALAAYEVYLVTGDKEWLKNSFEIISRSADADLITIHDKETGLMRGESSFLDWREQTYPAWMDPKDISRSMTLGTNAVHYRTYIILSEMAKLLGSQKAAEYTGIAAGIKAGINKYLWIKDKGYYGQYLYGRGHLSLSPKSEALGEALCVLFGIADEKREKEIVSRTPVMEFGIPCIYPQIPNMPPYHNDAVWPFVESFWAAASAKAGNLESAEAAMASVYRAASLFLTNKENMVASSGDHMGTEINSDRQLWSLAGNLSLAYRLIFGMNFTPDYLEFKPFVPESYGRMHSLRNFKYRDCILFIELQGHGNKIKSFSLDGEELKNARVPGNLKGRHELVIVMANNEMPESEINLTGNSISPETPVLKADGNKIVWDKTENADEYIVFADGKSVTRTKELVFQPKGKNTGEEIQVMAADKKGNQSFLSEPLILQPEDLVITEAEKGESSFENSYAGFSGEGYLMLDKEKNREVKLDFEAPENGVYRIDFRYANGSGPLITDNKCAVRNLLIDGKKYGALILPQRGEGSWTEWGYSNSFNAELKKGKHTVTVLYYDLNDNMNGKVNTALLDNMRLMKAN